VFCLLPFIKTDCQAHPFGFLGVEQHCPFAVPDGLIVYVEHNVHGFALFYFIYPFLFSTITLIEGGLEFC
jgi:hypothetical protein